jgi:hypothetical protein
MDVVALVSGCFMRNKKVGRLFLAVLDYMFHGSCRRVSKVLSMGLEPISKSAVHYLAKKVSEIRVAREPRYGRCIAVDETKLRVKKSYVYVWSAVDLDSRNYWLWRRFMVGAA